MLASRSVASLRACSSAGVCLNTPRLRKRGRVRVVLTTQAAARYPLVEQASCSDRPTRAARCCAKKHGWLDGGRWGDRCGDIELHIYIYIQVYIYIYIMYTGIRRPLVGHQAVKHMFLSKLACYFFQSCNFVSFETLYTVIAL